MKEFLQQFTNISLLFSLRPASVNAESLKALLALFGLLLVVALIFLVLAQKNKNDFLLNKADYKFFSIFITISLIGFLFCWLAYENVPVFAARLVLPILIIVFLVWLGFALRYRFKKIPKIKNDLLQKKHLKKYLP